MRINNKLGFSLLELLTVMLIVIILSSVAMASYHYHSIKVKRTDGQSALLYLAAQMEKYALLHPQQGYQEATFALLGMSAYSSQKFYQLNIVHADVHSYLIAATLRGASLTDKACSALAIDETGHKGVLQQGKIQAAPHCW